MSKKRTIESFFGPSSKKQRALNPLNELPVANSNHPTYPFPIPELPFPIREILGGSLPAKPGRVIDDQPDLDVLYFEPYIPRPNARQLFLFLRSQLPFYRVEYVIKRGGIDTHIKTPRYTTVFGLDETSRFHEGVVVDAKTRTRVPASAYSRYAPRPIPQCLEDLRKSTETATGCSFNFCLVNYYASGKDSISFHSDDERFLGPEPAIASLSLGTTRDFLLKHKPLPVSESGLQPSTKQLKLPLVSGDMVLMRGKTQANWLHSIPKRTGKNEEDGGRINITFRRALVKGGTDNYYNYNVGTGPVYRWDDVAKDMKPWRKVD